MTKLLENSFRLINIAFIDEMSGVCRELGLNISWKAREHERHANFIELAGEIIDELPQVLLGRIYDLLNKAQVTIANANFLILGANGRSYDSVDLHPALLREQDAFILLTDHTDIDYDQVVTNSRLVIDTRNKLAHFHAPNVHRM